VDVNTVRTCDHEQHQKTTITLANTQSINYVTSRATQDEGARIQIISITFKINSPHSQKNKRAQSFKPPNHPMDDIPKKQVYSQKWH